MDAERPATETMRVVVHLNDGRLLKGTTQDFFPNRPSFHLQPREGGEAIDVKCAQTKALFFVKSFEGDAQRRDLRGFISAPADASRGKKVAVRFRDGELLCGYSLSYLPDRAGFFMFPADVDGNNLRIYVVTASAAEIKAGPAAEALAQKVLTEEGT
jgi:hypothetical protein